MADLPPHGSSRRSIIGGALAASLLPSKLFAAGSTRLLAGTYAREGGSGLVPLIAGRDWLRAGAANGAVRNASFAVRSPRHGLRYFLDEQQQGALGVHDRALRRIETRSTLGSDPCHVALSPDGSALAVANYSSGSVALWRLDPITGAARGDAQLIRHTDHDRHGDRNAEPHAHWVGFTADGRILHAVDLGSDAIFAHRIDPQARTVARTIIAYRAMAGSGPRHLARHPRLPVAYLVAELANTVTTLRASPDGTFATEGMVSTLPKNFRASSAAGHLALDRAGTRLYVSNRGHDSIAVFGVETDGALRLLQHVNCGGHWPRFFLLMEGRREMLVANQRSGNVASLDVARDGRLHVTGRSVAVPGAAFLTV